MHTTLNRNTPTGGGIESNQGRGGKEEKSESERKLFSFLLKSPPYPPFHQRKLIYRYPGRTAGRNTYPCELVASLHCDFLWLAAPVTEGKTRKTRTDSLRRTAEMVVVNQSPPGKTTLAQMQTGEGREGAG